MSTDIALPPPPGLGATLPSIEQHNNFDQCDRGQGPKVERGAKLNEYQTDLLKAEADVSIDMEEEIHNDLAVMHAPAVSPLASFQSQPMSKKPRLALDSLVGCATDAIYSKMREVQHNHRPAYNQDSPYVKYRRFVHLYIYFRAR